MDSIVRSHALAKTRSEHGFYIGEIKLNDVKFKIWYFTIENELIIRKSFDKWMIKNNLILDEK